MAAPAFTLLTVTTLGTATVFAAWPLNDTGIVRWGSAGSNDLESEPADYPGQDASHGRDVTHADDTNGDAGFVLTKLDANGDPLPASAASWSCVRDEISGLDWEGKTDDGGLRDKEWTYTWYNPDPATNGGWAGIEDGGDNCYDAARCDTDRFVADVNAVGLCGTSDWRLPNREEMRSLVNYRRNNPSTDIAYFSDIGSDWWYWSSLPRVGGIAGDVWGIDFEDGNAASRSTNDAFHVRLVRVVQSPPQYAFTVSKAGTGSGTVTSAPPGIDCGSDCTEDYAEGTVVTLTPAPAAGSTFAGWSGHADCSDGQVTMNADKSCTATFGLVGDQPLVSAAAICGSPANPLTLPISLDKQGVPVASVGFTLSYAPDKFCVANAASDVTCSATAAAAGFNCTGLADCGAGTVQVTVTPPIQIPVPELPQGEIVDIELQVDPNADPGAGAVCTEEPPECNPLAFASVDCGDTGGATVGCLAQNGCADLIACAQGDCNGDGSVTTADVTCTILRIFGQIPPASACEDCNGDGNLSTADVTCAILCNFGLCP